MKEVGTITTYLAHAYRLDDQNHPRLWTRNEAIKGGLMIRLTKLQRDMLDAHQVDHFEISDLLVRPLVETIINIQYFIAKQSDALFDAYVEYSLREQKETAEG